MTKNTCVESRGKRIRLFSGRFAIMQEKPNLLVYEVKKNAIIPYNFNVPAYSFLGKIEQHLRNHQTMVPVVNEVTWQDLLEYNPALVDMQKKIIAYEGKNFSDEAWNILAQQLVRFLQKNHALVTTPEVITVETTVIV